MARKTGRPVNASIVTTSAAAITTANLKNPIVSAGLPGDPEIDMEAPQTQDFTRMALAARTRQRLQKYNVLQLRMLDMYALKKVKLNPMHIKLNKKLQKGHASEYEAILRAEGKTE